MPIAPPDREVIVFPKQPDESQKTFESGIPLDGDTEQLSRSLILFTPNYQLIASLDNQNSQITSTCGASFTRGFSKSSTQEIGISMEFGVGLKVFSFGFSIDWSLSFTQEWNASTTREMSFSCPPGARAFIYQGTLVYRILGFAPQQGRFSWQDDSAAALTDVLLTAADPILVPSDLIEFEQQR